MSKYYYQLPGSLNAYGPIEAKSERDCQLKAKQFWGLTNYMSYKVHTWIDNRGTDSKIAEKREFYKDVLKANPHLCLTDFE
jgi:hypothetical protein